jgi:hypothetical protein
VDRVADRSFTAILAYAGIARRGADLDQAFLGNLELEQTHD